MDIMDSDEDSILGALFQDSDNSGVEILQEIWVAPRLATQDANIIINQQKLRQTAHNMCLYTGYYKKNNMVVVRQRDDPEAPVDDLNEGTDSDKRKLPRDSNSTRVWLVRVKLMESVSVPTFAANMIHGP